MGKFPCFTNFGYLETVPMENLAILNLGKFPCFNFATSSIKGTFWNMTMSYMDLCPPKRELEWKFSFCFGKNFNIFKKSQLVNCVIFVFSIPVTFRRRRSAMNLVHFRYNSWHSFSFYFQYWLVVSIMFIVFAREDKCNLIVCLRRPWFLGQVISREMYDQFLQTIPYSQFKPPFVHKRVVAWPYNMVLVITPTYLFSEDSIFTANAAARPHAILSKHF